MPQPIRATIFAYQVGFGDCFLLRYDYDDGQRRHMLFDFGTTGLPEETASSQMLDIARDIAEKCTEDGADGLDVVVATHRHADHISGFATRADGKGSGDIIAALRPKAVVQPWTEVPDARLDWLGPDESSPAHHAAIRQRWRSLQAMQQGAQEAVAFAQALGKRLPPAVAGQISFIGEDNLANLSAVKNLQAMGDKGRHCFAYHGCDLGLGSELPGVEVHVLGPPTLRQTETIRKQRSRDKDEFWQLQPQRLAAARGPRRGAKALFPDATYRPATHLFTEQRWLAHRVDELNGAVMLSLVRALDKQMNNTSVILLMKAGSKSLLFPGDAQLENWQYALQSPLAAELDAVDLYKVGHHGSLNATPRSMWNRFHKRGAARKPDRLTSVLSTMHGKHGDDDKNTEVPRRTLVNELQAKSNLVSTENLEPKKLYQAIVLDLT
ncbi:hypothetical protein [Xanthobacter sp. ZOL 2024]